MYLIIIAVLVIAFLANRLQRSRVGRAWMAIREDEIAAKAMGINTRNMKLLAFGMGASFGGISGAMFAAFQGFVSPESFTFHESAAVSDSQIVFPSSSHLSVAHSKLAIRGHSTKCETMTKGRAFKRWHQGCRQKTWLIKEMKEDGVEHGLFWTGRNNESRRYNNDSKC